MGKYASRVGGRVLAAQRKKWLLAIIFIVALIALLATFTGALSWLFG